MAWLKAPKTNRYFWLFHLSGWGTFILVNFLTRQVFQVESLHQGLISMVVLLVVNTFLCLILREILHRFKLIDLNSRWLWAVIVLLIIGFGFLSALLITLTLGLYYLIFDYSSVLVFFMLVVYQNWLIMALLFGIWTVVYVITNHIGKLNALKSEQNQIKLQLKEAELNNLIGQLNPHFLFNGLNNIRGLMLEDVTRSRQMLTALSDLLRYSLNSPKHSLTSLADEIEVVRSYVSLSQIQYEERLKYIEDINPELMSYQIPPMMIQLLIENAIRHGIDHHTGQGELRLSIKKQDDQLIITVKNPGQLTETNINSKEQQTCLGLFNIQKRLSLLFPQKSTFTITQADQQVIATIHLPAIHKGAQL